MTESIDLDAYFARIGYAGSRDATLSTLRALCERHPKSIPFENLDTLSGRVPALDLASLQSKMVAGGRGGYCFEHNGLMEGVLTALGFALQPLAGRVQWGAAPDAPPRPRTHKLLRVATEEGDWLVDVGFGGLVLTAPLDLTRFEPQDTGHGAFRLQPVGGDLQVQARIGGDWSPKYQFSFEPQQPWDYEMANWFVATHATSPFHANLICSRVLDDRRLGLWNGELAVRWRDGRAEKRILDAGGLARALVEDFGLPEAAVVAAAPALERVSGL
jgi:N-hydroxyarylamine O-acetyltransferase